MLDPAIVEQLAAEKPDVPTVVSKLGLTMEEWDAALNCEDVRSAYQAGYRAFVEAAIERASQGKPVNVSKISVLTSKDRRRVQEAAANAPKRKSARRVPL